MALFDIFNAVVDWSHCRDQRPWLIVEVRHGGTFGCFPISGQCYAGDCFPICVEDPDFPATGLKKNCFVHTTHIIEVRREQFGNHREALTGQLLRDFRSHAGL